MIKSCALLTSFSCIFFLALSGGDPEHQLRGDGAQLPVSTSPAPRLQAVLCVPGQILGVPLWCQLLRGLQGEKKLSDASELCGVWIYCKQCGKNAASTESRVLAFAKEARRRSVSAELCEEKLSGRRRVEDCASEK